MRSVELSQGKITLVDDSDFEFINRYKWYYSNNGYAVRNVGRKPHRSTVLMHRAIAGIPDGFQCDHINGDRLDNQKVNLRVATQQQNSANQKIKIHSSVYKGVRFRFGKWEARIKKNQKLISLGAFDSEEIAAIAYDKAAKELFGIYAKTNL